MELLNLLKNSPLPPSRGGASFIQFGKGKYILLGGANRSEELNDIWVLYISITESKQLNGLWNKLDLQNQSIYTPRSGQQAFVDKEGHIYVFGGQKFETGQQTDEFFKIDIENKIMTIVTSKNKPKARNSHTLVYDELENVAYLYGGADSNGPLGDFHVYNLSSSEWKEEILAGDCVQPREMHTAHLITTNQDFTSEFSGKNDLDQKKLLTDFQHQVVELDFKFEGDDLAVNITKINIGQEEIIDLIAEPVEEKKENIVNQNQTKYLVCIGGRFITDILNDVLLINLQTYESIKLFTSLSSPLCAHTSCIVNHNQIVIFGGCNTQGFSDEILVFDLEKKTSQKKDISKQFDSNYNSCARIAISSLFSEEFKCIILFGGSSIEEESNQVTILYEKYI